MVAPSIPSLLAAFAFGSKYSGCRSAAGKLSACWIGRFTAFTVCGVIHHSPRSIAFVNFDTR